MHISNIVQELETLQGYVELTSFHSANLVIFLPHLPARFYLYLEASMIALTAFPRSSCLSSSPPVFSGRKKISADAVDRSCMARIFNKRCIIRHFISSHSSTTSTRPYFGLIQYVSWIVFLHIILSCNKKLLSHEQAPYTASIFSNFTK